MAEQPLLTKMIQCPACEKQAPLRTANPHLYMVESRESDRHVTRYRWLREIVTTVVPHYYAVWQCPHCLFADFAERIDKDKPDDQHEDARGHFLDIAIEKRMVLDSLRELVPEGELDLKGAVATHLATLLILTLPTSEKKIDHARVGSIALRLAWLFRERQDLVSVPELPVTGSQAISALAQATERLDGLVKDAGEVLRDIQRQGKLRGLELKRAATPEANPYLAVSDLIEVRLATLQAEVTSLQMAVLQDQQGRMAPLKPEIPAGVEGVDKALLAITALWPELPRTERQGLLLALEAFEYAYQFEGGEESVEQAMAQVNLILEILIRLGDLDRALEWTAQISKYASDTATNLQARIGRDRATSNLSAYDETVISRKIAALGLTRQKAGERRRSILELMLERDQETVDRVLAETSQLSPEARSQALTAAGIHDGVKALLGKALGGDAKASAGWLKKLMN